MKDFTENFTVTQKMCNRPVRFVYSYPLNMPKVNLNIIFDLVRKLAAYVTLQIPHILYMEIVKLAIGVSAHQASKPALRKHRLNQLIMQDNSQIQGYESHSTARPVLEQILNTVTCGRQTHTEVTTYD